MFTIRNNQINVNSEIIGGSSVPPPSVGISMGSSSGTTVASGTDSSFKKALIAAGPGATNVVNSLGTPVGTVTYNEADLNAIKKALESGLQYGGAEPGDSLIDLELVKEHIMATIANSATTPEVKIAAIEALNIINNTIEAINSKSGNIDLITTVGKLGAKKDWIRNNDLDLVYTEADGKEISLAQYYIKKENEATLKNQTLGNSLKCFSTSSTNTIDSAKDSTDACVKVLLGDDVLKMNSVEVAKLHPEVVFGVLKYLGFQMQESGGLNQVQSWSAWTKTVNLKTMNKFAQETPGVTYWQGQNVVSNLINFINSRPAILNKGASSKVEDVRKIGLMASKNSYRTDLSNHRNAIDMALNTLMFQVRGLMPSAGLTPFNAYSAYTASGGAMVVPVGVQPSRRASIDRLPEFTKQLRNLYQGYVQRLESMKKTLSPNTKKQVEAVFKQCEEHEAKVKALLTHFDSYARLSQLDGNRAEKVYNATDLHESYSKLEKHVGKSRRRYWSILDIAGVTGDAASDAEGSPLVMP